MATTGTQASGSGTFTGLNDMLKQVYTKPFENNIEKESEVADLINQAEGFEVIDGPDGKQVNSGHIFSSGGGVGAINEDDYLYTPTNPTTKQSSITIKELVAVVELSGPHAAAREEGPAAFVTWADEALPRKAQRLAFHKDRMYIGTGTGIIGRYLTNPPTGTADVINDAFGIAGLEGARTSSFATTTSARAERQRHVAPRRHRARRLERRLRELGDEHDGRRLGGRADVGRRLNDYLFLGDANVQGIGSAR
jgi:hypothetical protein